MSSEDFRRTYRMQLTTRERRECPCGCRQRLPWFAGELNGPLGLHFFEAAFVHREGQRRLLVALRGPLLKQQCAAWAFSGTGGQTTYQPAPVVDPALLQSMRPGVVTDPKALAAMFALIDVLLFNQPDAAIHLAGPTEAMRQALDFSFRLPDALLAVPRGERQINENFARLEARRFVRALLPLPVLGGEDFRVGLWFEVDEAGFVAVERRANGGLTGTVDNGFSLQGQAIAGVSGQLQLDAGRPVPTVRDASAAWLQQAMREVRSSDEHFALVREITDSYLAAQVARSRK